MKYVKSDKVINEGEFLQAAKKVKSFSSSSGKKYVVTDLNGDELSFKRIDSKKPDKNWYFDLKKVFEAYNKLSDFRTENFKKYVPIKHSPARGLLIHLGLLIEQ
jgi:hypothetical protein